jgi:hypothetical protein
VVLESGASVELTSKVKFEIHLLEQLKADTVKDQGSNKFVVSVPFNLLLLLNEILNEDNLFK